MTNTVACGEAAVFRAVAAMSGQLPSPCAGSHPIAYWASHGMSDPTIAIANGQAARDEFLSVDHCGAQTTHDRCRRVSQLSGLRRPAIRWSGVRSTASIEPPPFAGAAIWRFFSQF